MELVDIIPEFNLYEEFWRIYTKSDNLPPQYIAPGSSVTKSIIGEGTEIYGNVEKSVIGSAVKIGKGAVIKDSIIMNNVEIGDGAIIDKAILAEGVKIGKSCELGVGEPAENDYKPSVYAFDLVTIGENSIIPDNVKIGKNTAILGETTAEDYPDGLLPGGGSIIREAGE
jgi:glucose-1-phosphate adenylyltransferase